MNYSSAVFLDFSEDLGSTPPKESLEDAQMRKMRRVLTLLCCRYLIQLRRRLILKKANIQDGDRVLEIGEPFPSPRDRVPF
jgi:cyclopropane fatty-acyl-phospholipid synthase-like methyltransferase